MHADAVVESWHIHARIVRFVLDGMADGAAAAPKPTGARHPLQMFGHMHGVRLAWLEPAAAALAADLPRLSLKSVPSRADVAAALDASAQAIGRLLATALAGDGPAGGRISGFKPHATAFMGYLVAHEAYHLGEIGFVLREMGFPLDKAVAFGMWEWGQR